MLRVVDGSVLPVRAAFLDDDTDEPLYAAPGYPKVALLDPDNHTLVSSVASASSVEGEWEAALALPLLGLSESKTYTVRWRMLTNEGEKYTLRVDVLIDPKVERRDSEIVVLEGEDTVEFVLPFEYSTATPSNLQIYTGNNEVLMGKVDLSNAAISVSVGVGRSLVSFDALPFTPSLKSNLLVVRSRINGRPKTFNYKYWCITPAISIAMSLMEDMLNKARIENVIPELEYTAGDMMSYLERGLYLFNNTGISTSFTGTNMQGMLLDAWLTCSSYYAFAAQLLAEGSLAFDFSGQEITLNVDRTPQIESALGRIEARIQDTVLPLKKQITNQGFFGGDGSQGASAMRNPYSTGILSLTNAPTTRVSGFTNFIGRRF